MIHAAGVVRSRDYGITDNLYCTSSSLMHRCGSLIFALGRLECLGRGLRALHTVGALTVLGALSAAHLGSTDRAGRWASEQGGKKAYLKR